MVCEQERQIDNGNATLSDPFSGVIQSAGPVILFAWKSIELPLPLQYMHGFLSERSRRAEMAWDLRKGAGRRLKEPYMSLVHPSSVSNKSAL